MNQFLEASGASGPLLLGVGVPGSADQETRVFDLPFVLVGRNPRSDLRLDSPEVSERHAYFQIVSGQLFCIDLGSADRRLIMAAVVVGVVRLNAIRWSGSALTGFDCWRGTRFKRCRLGSQRGIGTGPGPLAPFAAAVAFGVAERSFARRQRRGLRYPAD